jgi:tetratricopeptide (TPR) repeat protein
MAGVGKTALVLHAAHQIADRFPDGQLFVDLRAYTDGLDPVSTHHALDVLLRSLGVRPAQIPQKTEDRGALYRERLAGTRTLVVLDNARDSAQVELLLPAERECLALVTSRRKLGLDDVKLIPLDILTEAEAEALFRVIVGSGRVASGASGLAEIAALCGRLPLALRITAARLQHRPTMSVADLARQLRDERVRLARLADDSRSMAGVLELSYRSLPDPEKDMFRRLGVVPGLDVESYAAASLAGIDVGQAEQLLDLLVDHNLLLPGKPGRYQFHDLVRTYARGLAANWDGTPVALGRLLDYYLYAARVADQQFEHRIPRIDQPVTSPPPLAAPTLGTPAEAQAWIFAELSNLVAAARAALSSYPDHVIGLSAAIAQYLRTHGPWTAALDLHRLAHDTALATWDKRGEAAALTRIAVVQRLSGAFSLAEETLEQALGAFCALTDRRAQAGVLTELGIVHRICGRYDAAERVLGQALDAYRELADRHGQAGVLAELGIVYLQRGDLTQAKLTLTTALDHYRQIGNRYGRVGTIVYLGSVYAAADEFEPAQEALGEALPLYGELGDRRGLANAHLFLGRVQRDAGHYDLAQESLQAALRIYDELDEIGGCAGALTFLGVLHMMVGDHVSAGHCLTKAIVMFRDLHDRGGEVEALIGHASLIAVTASPAQGRTEYERALKVAREIASRKDEADAIAGIAGTYRTERDAHRAMVYYRGALRLYETLRCAADAARIRQALGELDAGQ